MKRMMILLLAALIGLAWGAAAEEAPGEDVPLRTDGTRYYFEHRLLPGEFYREPEEMMDAMAGDGLYDRWVRYAAEKGVSAGYTAGDFTVREMMQDSGIRMAVLIMPTPEENLLCYRIYLCLDPESGKAAYFTAEFDEHDALYDDGCLICGWSADGVHSYYEPGKILPEPGDPAYEKALAGEAAAVLNLMRNQSGEQPAETADPGI